MVYLLLKSLHVFAVILWIGSLFLVSLITSITTMNTDQMRSATRITEAGIGVAWLAGVILVVMGGWYAATWWQLKIVLVLIISAIHTIVHRRWRASGPDGASTHASLAFTILLLTLLIIVLVIFKFPV